MPQIYIKPLILFLTIFILFNESCTSRKKLALRYINNDSTAIFSTHSSRPFKYGYAYSKEECELFRSDLSIYNIKNGDRVADVGAASGWLEGVFSVMLDSVTFYIQDIDTNYLNVDQLSRVVNYYSSLRSTPQTNTFKLVIGSRKKTNLPDSLFDKILIINTFHEIQYPDAIIQDLTTKLAPDGQVIVLDRTSNIYKRIKHKGCNITARSADWIINSFEKFGLHLTNMTSPKNSFQNDLIFEFNKPKSDAFKLKLKMVEPYISELELYNLKAITSDSLLTQKIAFFLKPHVKEITDVYYEIESYLNELGYMLLDENRIKEAINVFKASVILFPGSFNTYDGLGDAYFMDNNYVQAFSNYSESLKLHPGNTNAIERIKKIEEKLMN